MKVLVFAAGQIHNYDRVKPLVGNHDLILCADGGVRHALVMGLTPDLVLGDFDSTDPELWAEVQARGIPVRRYRSEKDETDTELAIQEAVDRGADEILLLGATGDRLDHTIANLLLLPGLPPNIHVTVADANNVIHLLREGAQQVRIQRMEGQYISLLPLSQEVVGIHTEGVKWPLQGATLRWGKSLGVSNQVVEEEAAISIEGGYLLVIQARD